MIFLGHRISEKCCFFYDGRLRAHKMQKDSQDVLGADIRCGFEQYHLVCHEEVWKKFREGL